MSEYHIGTIFNTVQKQYFNKKYKKIEVSFHPFRSLKHTIEWTPWRIRIRVNEHFRFAPDDIIEKLAIILLAKVYKAKVGKNIRKNYNEYVDTIRDKLPAKKYNRLDSYTAKGHIYDLSEIFETLNKSYFKDSLRNPTIGWSRKKSYWRLGFYDKERNLLVISRVFDHPKVPIIVVKYLVYHEMLHIFFPSERKNGRRVIHSSRFRETERQFPEYEEIQDWLKLNLRKL
jgi:predicted metal-dependent hydrolase